MTDLPDASPLPLPRFTLRGVAAAAALWTLFTFIYTIAIVQSGAGPFMGVLIGQVIQTAILAGLSVPIWWLVVRRMDRKAAWMRLTTHVVLGPLYAWASTELYLGVLRATAPPSVEQEVMGAYAWLAIAFFWVYALQFAVYHGIRSWQRLRASEKRALEWMALARERELATLRAQVQPHFLFNTLNSISATVGRDPDASRAMLARLADLLRYALESGTQPDVPLRRELDVARDYLMLEGHRMRDRLSVDFQIDDRAADARLPPMTIQPLVENAIKHGLAPSIQGGTIRVGVAVEDAGVVVTVEDDGSGPASGDGGLPQTLSPSQVASTGVGLDNTSRRLVHLHGASAALESGPIEPQGWRVRFRLPLDHVSTTAPLAATAHA